MISQQYLLKLSNGKIIERSLVTKSGNSKLRHLLSPATNSKLNKIYIIRAEGEVVYIGITKQALSKRLRSGLLAGGKHGYHGYKWKRLEQVDMLVYFFPDSIDRVEAIEAEIVYLVRRHTERWPKYQTEIHFHQATSAEKKNAARVFRDLKQ